MAGETVERIRQHPFCLYRKLGRSPTNATGSVGRVCKRVPVREASCSRRLGQVAFRRKRAMMREGERSASAFRDPFKPLLWVSQCFHSLNVPQ
jgi:hypothetical protein